MLHMDWKRVYKMYCWKSPVDPEVAVSSVMTLVFCDWYGVIQPLDLIFCTISPC